MVDVVGYSVEDNADIETSIINAAKKHFKEGNYNAALKLYLGLLKTSASSKLYLDVGICFYKKGDFDSAIEYLNQSSQLDITNSLAFSYLGNCYFRKLNANKAIENWTIARSISPKDEFVCLNLAIAYFAKNMLYESVFYYDKYLKYAQIKDTKQYQSIQKNINEQFRNANDLFIAGQNYLSKNEKNLALTYYLQAVRKYPIISEYSLAVADLYYESKSYADALHYYDYATRNNKDMKNIYLKMAKCYESVNDYRMAYCFYNRYLKYIISLQDEYLLMLRKISNIKKFIDESSIDITLELAKKHYENNEYYEALTEYENIIILNPELKFEYVDEINKLNSFINSEDSITKNYLEKGNKLLLKGEIKGANKYFTEVMHLASPSSNEYKLAKSKLVNVK